jgi:methylmalonyl-CoA/ethylmalonyl-CoA epimerase
MRFRGIHHIGVAVRDLEEALSRWASLFGAHAGSIEENSARGVRLAELRFEQGPAVELVTPLGEGSPVAKFLKERGEGIHHFALEVDDLEAAMEELRRGGLAFVSEKPQTGAGGSLIGFIHPRGLDGVLLELRQPPKSEDR